MREGGSDDADRLRFERLLQWLRLTFLLSPFLALAAFGAAALPYAFAIAGAVALSYGGVEVLLRRTPHTLLQHQLGLRFVDIVLTGAVLTAYHSFLGDAYFDSVYLLFVVAGAGTQGRGGAVLLAAASGAGVFVTRLLLILNGAMPYETRHLTDAVFYMVFFLVVGTAVAFLMQRSAVAVARREAAFRKELAACNAVLEQTAHERDAALGEARQAIHSRDNFLATASHDLKNPLTVISGTAQILARVVTRDPAPSERTVAGLRRIVRAAERMQSQLDELVEASRAGTSVAPEPRLEPVDLGALLVEIAATYQSSEREVRVDVGEPHVMGLWDRVRLGRVLDNLLSNAVKYSPLGSPVDVRLAVAFAPDPVRAKRTDHCQMDQPRARWAVLTVSDRGIGIPEAEQSRVFEPFFRAANVTDCVPGTGVGLAATRQIVEALGSAITLRSTSGEGTTFTVHLPLEQPG